MFNITSKYFSIFNNKPPASWVAHVTRDFITCYSCSYYSSMNGWASLNNKLSCYKNPSNSFWIDLILKYCTKSFQNITEIEARLSGIHKMVVTIMKTNFRELEPRIVRFRNFWNFTKWAFQRKSGKSAFSYWNQYKR